MDVDLDDYELRAHCVHCTVVLLEPVLHPYENYDLLRAQKMAAKHNSSVASSSPEASSSALVHL